ncbi:MAG: flagellar assembly protein FliX [Rhodospirillaceae bacterium]|nr:flagellar assembly protein FliX [Rhodospirillaceae bacterium]MBT4490094.1 flagellar assembly protein FliX [Rhodospirillaceae bacterium]MBT5047864.1 flagellar assembly protein FliX [Rhodospirillaceae bacterium]MBT5896144.1 flagellar assembly protein FliX [Rhodospirillaceae bacterium]
MKISGSGSIRSNATRRAGRKGGDGGATFRVESGGGAEAAAQTGAASSVAGVGSLLALQEVPDALEQRRQAVLRSTDILDELQQLRMGLLTGSVPRQRLQRLMKLLQDRPGGYADPQLDNIIGDIEVRAAVELAKLEMTDAARK